MIEIPAWVVRAHTPAAVTAYALLSEALSGGTARLSVGDAVRRSQMNPSTATRALRELRDSGAIKRIGNAKYVIRLDPPVHIAAELSTVFSTGSPQSVSSDDAAADAGSVGPQRELSTLSTGPTTTARRTAKASDLLAGLGKNVGEGEEITPDESHFQEPPRAVLIGGRNLAFDALSEECNADPRARGGEIARALAKIRVYVWEEFLSAGWQVRGGPDEQFENALANAIRKRAAMYRVRLATITPTALAKWWFDLEKIPAQGLTPEQIASGNYGRDT